MSILGLQSNLTSVSGYSSVFGSGNITENVFRGSISGRQSSSAEGGTFHGTLKMGYLHSEFSPVTGQELHMKYDDSSSESAEQPPQCKFFHELQTVL